ncbi:MAG: phage major capsid protein [Candidatus Abyssobacteria bacterium SURF_17]|uniref:Phage major capsid protein n=1 Tax=Candidatus Abyssobacteria bacterium SURF_17 TaxID=2093361 RepID=A0A419EWK0_9BACT|nr:MAG: phage major capsid protein [Candidatus Abyssubacteria bacterium SURF_17]
MVLKLENKKYTREEIEALVEREAEERAQALFMQRKGRKGEFPVPREQWGITKELPIELQHQSDVLYIASKLLNKDPRHFKLWDPFYKDVVKTEFGKAMDTATSGEGAEWIPTDFSPELLRSVKLQLKVAMLHRWIKMPTNPFKLPFSSGGAHVYLAGESTSDTATKFTASTPASSNLELDAVKLAGRILYSGELEEDSVIATGEFTRAELITALAEAIEDCCINGDDSTTHQDTDVTDADDWRKGWKGYRKLTAAGAKVDLSTFSITTLRSIRTAMVKYGVNPATLAWIAGVKVYNKMLGISEVLTVDKYGMMATLLQGELAKLDGIPVIVSEKIRENLNASGVYDGVTETKTVLPLVNRNRFIIGERRTPTVKILRELYAESDQVGVVVTQRLDFIPLDDTSSEYTSGLGYNIA